MFKHASKALTLTLWLHRTTKYLFWGILLSLTSLTVHKSLSSAFINWTCFYIILHIDLSLNCQHSYTMYNKNVRGSEGAGIGSILSRGDAGTPSELCMMHGWHGRSWKCSSPPPTSVLFLLAYAQQLIHLWALRCSTPSMTWQVVLPLVERRSGAPRRQGAAAGETAASLAQGRRTLLRPSPGLRLAPLKAGLPSVLSASACSPKFTILTLLYKS